MQGGGLGGRPLPVALSRESSGQVHLWWEADALEVILRTRP